jgi:putative DNA methylase
MKVWSAAATKTMPRMAIVKVRVARCGYGAGTSGSGKALGLEGLGGRPVPMIDRVHRLMQLWKEGDLTKVNAFLDQTGLARDGLFTQLVQALIELARHDGKTDEAPIIESISNHLRSRAGVSSPAQALLI